jgi:hypothetical protein
VSAGFDAYARDPLAEGALLAEDFHWLGQLRIARVENSVLQPARRRLQQRFAGTDFWRISKAWKENMPFQSPLTLLILGLTVGYYLVYQTGLLIHNHDKK